MNMLLEVSFTKNLFHKSLFHIKPVRVGNEHVLLGSREQYGPQDRARTSNPQPRTCKPGSLSVLGIHLI